MMLRNAMRVCSMLLVASLASTGMVPVSAQENDHVVSSVQLRKDLQSNLGNPASKRSRGCASCFVQKKAGKR